jgi:hypothetical protein
VKATTKFATRCSVGATDLFRKETSDAEQAPDLISQEDAPRRWPHDEIDVTPHSVDHLKALGRKDMSDLCCGRRML